MPHSALFESLTTNVLGVDEVYLNPEDLIQHFSRKALPNLTADGHSLYDQMTDLLRETIDAQFGIVSTLVENEWVRDAREAKHPLDERISHDSPIIEANNALLRCLSRLRPIDFAIGRKYPGEEGNAIREKLKAKFLELTQNILEKAQSDYFDNDKLKSIKDLETQFNTDLVEALHEANLTQGCDSRKDAEKLLFHYRNLSSLLVPARPMITLTYDAESGVLHRETQYPVTEKTPLQIEEIKKLAELQSHPLKHEKNSHNVRNIATQEADSLFAGLMAEPDRALPAQARKTHLVGTKNAFIVKNELMAITPQEAQLEDVSHLHPDPNDKESTLWLARTGVPVYIGKGETDENIQTHTQENLEQIRMAAEQKMELQRGSLKLHVTCLNTVSPLQSQALMVDHIIRATAAKDDATTYAPTNEDGLCRFLSIASILNFGEGKKKPWGSAPFRKATRLNSVSTIVLEAANTEGYLSVVNCASGQDRTGTALLKAVKDWMSDWFRSHGKDPSKVEDMLAGGGNAAEITAHHIHGSPGMKKNSMANNIFGSLRTFGKKATEQLYLSSANTNKMNTVANDLHFLKQPSALAIKEFEDNLDIF